MGIPAPLGRGGSIGSYTNGFYVMGLLAIIGIIVAQFTLKSPHHQR